MTSNRENVATDLRRRQGLLVAGGLLAAIAASSCCMLPLLMFGLGVSGAWIGYLTRLAPYQPYFMAVAFACLGYGVWLARRSSSLACRESEACVRARPGGLVQVAGILAALLVLAALVLDFVGPVFFSS